VLLAFFNTRPPQRSGQQQNQLLLKQNQVFEVDALIKPKPYFLHEITLALAEQPKLYLQSNEDVL
jgi:hypothetical protein